MLHLTSAGSARLLADRLAELWADVPPDPLTPEWLAVPSDGMRRWLTLEVARHLGASPTGTADGIVANIVRAYPGDLRSAVLAIDRPADRPEPWAIERLVWPVLEVVGGTDGGGGRSFGPLAGVGVGVADGGDAGVAVGGGVRGYATARRIADLFDRYHLHRPHMVRAWARGRAVDGAGRDIAKHAAWQYHLWREVRARIGEPSPPERLPSALRRLHVGEDLVDLPPRLVLFGFTVLPAGAFLEVARAVAVTRDVHVFLLEPTSLDPVGLGRSSPPPTDGSVRLRGNDPTASLANHPLLRSWGRLHRETALQLADVRAEGVPVHRLDQPEPGNRPSTLLGRLQHDLRANLAPRPTLADDPADDSVQFHSCFGATRQAEVLRDALLHLLARPGSTLTEDDIVVLCPALDRFAPLIEAAFGRSAVPATATSAPDRATGSHGPPSLRYRFADRSIRTTNPVLSATASLLDLVAGRFELRSVLEFLALGPVRQRFGFDDERLSVIAEWMEATNVRWGLDPVQRERQGLPRSVVSNTWRSGMDRLLLGSAVFDEPLGLAVGDVAPFGVEGTDVETVGSVASIVEELTDLAGATVATRPINAWVDRIRCACTTLFATEDDQAWQLEALDRILGEVVESATDGVTPSPVALSFADVARLLGERLDGQVGRADFFRGGITVTSMTPLRWVPFRVVCILGMDQSAFTSEGSASDDLSALVPHLGDRDPRGESREALMEAVLAAEDRLIVVRDGHDVRTNQEVPKAVVTAELFESVLASVVDEDRVRVAARLEVDHPRQPFDERCFEEGMLVAGVPWGFDGDDLEGAMARRRRTHRRRSFLDEPLPEEPSGVIELSELHRFLLNPAAAFLTGRLGVRLPEAEWQTPTVVPVAVDGLAGWDIGDRLLTARLSGFTFEQWLRYERRVGTLPPPPLAGASILDLGREVDAMVDAAGRAGVLPTSPTPYPVDAVLPDGTRVVGSTGLRLEAGAPGPAVLHYSRFRQSHRVAAWLDLMALVATEPTTPWRSVAVSRNPKNGGAPVVTDLVPSADVDGDRARAAEALAVVARCYRVGMTEPLPLFPNFSYQVFIGKDGPGSWRGFRSPEDGDRPAVRLAFDRRDYDGISHLEARPTDPDVPQADRGRVWRFAVTLYRTVGESSRVRPTDTQATVPAPMEGGS